MNNVIYQSQRLLSFLSLLSVCTPLSNRSWLASFPTVFAVAFGIGWLGSSFTNRHATPMATMSTAAMQPMAIPMKAPRLSSSVPVGHCVAPDETHVTVCSSFMNEIEYPFTLKSVSSVALSLLYRLRAESSLMPEISPLMMVDPLLMLLMKMS